MKPIGVTLGQDQVEKLSKASAIQALEEMLWNSFDADADWAQVTTELDDNDFGVVALRILDNGEGISHEDVEAKFGMVGGSAKNNIRHTNKLRTPRGKLGRGRYKAFALAKKVRWVSRYKRGNDVYQFTIEGDKSRALPYSASEPVRCSDRPGVEVVIAPIERAFPELRETESICQELAKRMALAMHTHKFDVRVNGQTVTPDKFIKHRAQSRFTLPHDGEALEITLDILEWDGIAAKNVYLCDKEGIPQHEWDKYDVTSGKHFSYTVYARSILIDRLSAKDAFLAEDMHDDVANLKSGIRSCLEGYFRSRRSDMAGGLVASWKKEGVYPYNDSEDTPVTLVSREVFDVCAETVHELLPKFESGNLKSRKLIFKLLRQAVETDTGSLCDILDQVLSLGKQQQDELAAILKSARLGAVISAAKTVLDRLKFLVATEHLFFGDRADEVNEPHQLQQILLKELWLFGDEFTYGRQEAYLVNALEVHAAHTGQSFDPNTGAIYNLRDGKKSRLDILLNSTYARTDPYDFEHLVIELKRSSVKLGSDELAQIESYALTVGKDNRFDKLRTKWTWILIGVECDEYVEGRRMSQDRPPGLIANRAGMQVWVKTWSEIISAAKRRYEFFLKQLEVELTADDGLKYLRERHEQYLPSALKATVAASLSPPPAPLNGAIVLAASPSPVTPPAPAIPVLMTPTNGATNASAKLPRKKKKP